MMNWLGLSAETLPDEIKAGTGEVAFKVDAVCRKARERKKEIAEERRSKTLAAMSTFGNVSTVAGESREAASSRAGATVRETVASFLAPVLSFFISSILAAGSSSFLAGSGISAMFGSSFKRAGSSGRSITAETPSSALPPMMVTYGLAGVDGEATEDNVSEPRSFIGDCGA